MSLNTPMLNSDSVSPLVLGEPMDGGTGSSLGWVAVRCLYLSQAYAWASCGPLQVTHWLSFVSGGIVLSLIILVASHSRSSTIAAWAIGP
ncbi:hypothetical protein AAZX31_08G242400 [Glycine max]|uniref:Uncharacterized protein n=1 Tax=Glycine soja TaxID=3848 RepID=A0A445JJM2_GLYSO|nr:hypothetical protein JHK87_022282 [Glycine soja]KAH1052966.1 hypothetical protein GYH30_022313 [Glycine max]RZB98682.1 hypothetical protein D0Y65_021537 [Glycine soja]